MKNKNAYAKIVSCMVLVVIILIVGIYGAEATSTAISLTEIKFVADNPNWRAHDEATFNWDGTQWMANIRNERGPWPADEIPSSFALSLVMTNQEILDKGIILAGEVDPGQPISLLKTTLQNKLGEARTVYPELNAVADVIIKYPGSHGSLIGGARGAKAIAILLSLDIRGNEKVFNAAIDQSITSLKFPDPSNFFLKEVVSNLETANNEHLNPTAKSQVSAIINQIDPTALQDIHGSMRDLRERIELDDASGVLDAANNVISFMPENPLHKRIANSAKLYADIYSEAEKIDAQFTADARNELSRAKTALTLTISNVLDGQSVGDSLEQVSTILISASNKISNAPTPTPSLTPTPLAEPPTARELKEIDSKWESIVVSKQAKKLKSLLDQKNGWYYTGTGWSAKSYTDRRSDWQQANAQITAGTS